MKGYNMPIYATVRVVQYVGGASQYHANAIPRRGAMTKRVPFCFSEYCDSFCPCQEPTLPPTSSAECVKTLKK